MTAPHPALSSRRELLALLDAWVERGWLRAIDRAFAVFLHRECENTSPLLLLAAALASHQLGRGHVCLDLAQTLRDPDLALSLPPEGDDLPEPPPLPSALLQGLTAADWRTALERPELVEDGPGATPLVLSAGRLYLRRFWRYEQQIHQSLNQRLSHTPEFSADQRRILGDTLATLFPRRTGQLDWQQLACALAARSRFSIITGGPGTGKTTTVVKLLALLQAMQLMQTRQLGEENARPLRIRLAAPTGKAAARLNESIASQVAALPLESTFPNRKAGADQRVASDGEARRSSTKTRSLQGVNEQFNRARGEESFNTASPSAAALRAAIPTEVTTLHRLLGARPDTRHFRHHARNPLALDVLVVDEASMVDIEMMAALLAALPSRARLILLGDKDQLASVEAGSVLGDLCARAEGAHYTPATAAWLAETTGQAIPEIYLDIQGQPLDQAIAMLRVSHRFSGESGIGKLAEAINAPLAIEERWQRIRQVWDADFADIRHLRIKEPEDSAFAELIIDGGYRHYLDTLHEKRPAIDADQATYDGWARQVLEAHGSFQLLCALRRGNWGIEGLNERVRELLEQERLIDSAAGKQGWYLGRPVLVTRNDYGLGLMNGDIGITLALPHPHQTDKLVLRVAFPANDGSGRIQWVLPSRLQAVETVYAMTVHKSQGSEFLHTALVLPDRPNPILTRELIYTGITRAKHRLTLVESGRGMLKEAVSRKVMRVSGLGGKVR
ncbi:exodeoxyribonuclease V subunit alpha [Pistricoccus aurantiacus]|uniref:RecBCD enzyme subunit RecD n=1 Tax=Pistricoccus aurantiacus TaxID=1883414 RepID=A0A5B8SRF4_9GAMM|nr:exodeoxyribonuclease V subunit alpha [Pistricoccus aurantiacus]QEA37723.1 exodeoxyribonuclease V subunit alpha [Pistricoccus aurantiacus]